MYIEKSVRCQAKSTSSVIKDLNYNTSDMPIKPVIKVYSPKKHWKKIRPFALSPTPIPYEPSVYKISSPFTSKRKAQFKSCKQLFL